MSDNVNGSGKPVNGNSGRIHPKLQGEIQKRNIKVSMEGDVPSDVASMAEKYGHAEDVYGEIEKLRSMSKDPGTRALIEKEMIAQAEKVRLFAESHDTAIGEHAGAANRELAKRIQTHTSYYNVNKRTTTASSDQEYFRRSKDPSILQTPTEVLQERKERLMNQASEMGGEIAGGIRGLGTASDVDDVTKERIEKLSKVEDEISLTKRTIKTQAKYGMTTEKRQHTGEETLSRVGNLLGASTLAKDVSAGKYGNVDKETEKLQKLFEALSSSMEKFEGASEHATDAQGNLTEEYKKASKDLNDIQKETDKQRAVVIEVSKQGGGGGGYNVASGARTFRNMADQAYAIDQQDVMEETRLKTGMAGRAVQQYNRANSAIGGDMGSLLREAGGQDFIKGYSDKIRSSAMRQAGVNIGLTGVDTFAQVAADGISLNTLGSPGAAAQKATEALGVGAMSIARQGMAMHRGIPQTQRALEASGAAEGFVNTMQSIDTGSLQKFYDQNMAARGSTIGRGSGAAAAEFDLTDPRKLKEMANAGLTPGRAAQLAALGTSGMGGSGSIVSMTQRAGAVEMGRTMSAEQYMGMSGQLTGAGGGATDLEEIMKNAVSAGMDNAKNIQQMVSATVAMSGGLAKIGVSGGGVGDLLGASVQRLRSTGVDANIATGTAANAIGVMNQNSTSLALDMSTMYKRGKLREVYGGLDTTQADVMSSLSQEDFATLAGGGGKAFSKQIGMNDKLLDKGGNVDKKKLVQAQHATRMAFLMPRGLATGMINKEEATAFAEQNIISDNIKRISKVGGFNAEALPFMDEKGTFGVNKGKVQAGAQTATDEVIKAQAKQEEKQIAYAKDMIGSMDKLAIAINALVESDISDPKKAQDRVQQAADTMKEPAAFKELSGASKALKDAADNLNKYAGKSGQGEHIPPRTNVVTTNGTKVPPMKTGQ